tara:strand:- start:200 stop:835 length:636 start_codon:yes stop_codon:yes gene_type:complete
LNHNLYDIRIIKTTEDYHNVSTAWSSCTKIMRQVNNFSFLKNINFGKIIGAYLGDDLVGTLKYTKWNTMPFYTVGALYIKPGLIKRYDFSDPKNPINYITDFMLKTLEDQEYYNWYYIRTLGNAYAKIERDNNDLLTCTSLGPRYSRYVEEIVPPGCKSKHALHNTIMADTTWKRPIMIVKCSLSNQYRKHGDVFRTESEIVDVKKNTKTH